MKIVNQGVKSVRVRCYSGPYFLGFGLNTGNGDLNNSEYGHFLRSEYWSRKPSNILKDLMNSNEIFRKEVAYDNIKRYKKPEFRPLTRKNIFQLTTVGSQIDTPSILFRVKAISIS